MNVSDNAYRFAVLMLAIISGFAALSLAQNVFAPTLTAIVIGVVFSPLANTAERMGAPRVIVAITVLAIGLLFIGGAVLLLEGPVRELIDAAPRIWARIESQLVEVRRVLSGLEEISSDISEAVDGGSGAATVVANSTNQLFAALTFAPTALAQMVIFIGALFFFILSRRDIYDAIARLGTSPEGRLSLSRRLTNAEHYVSRYFVAITIINVLLGLATYAVLYALGVPSPVLWGVMAGFLNFMPYLGPSLVTAGLVVAGLVLFDGPYSFVPAASFLALNLVEGQFVTPAFVGKQMRVNSLLVFVSLVFWLWLWGPIGGFVAIPVLLAILAFLQPE